MPFKTYSHRAEVNYDHLVINENRDYINQFGLPSKNIL